MQYNYQDHMCMETAETASQMNTWYTNSAPVLSPGRARVSVFAHIYFYTIY